MRIKFLSIIASFFMVSFLITSCLDNDTNIEYSSDATIHEFALDTIGRGVNYKFTIDQLNGLIYNEDSMPVHADTIVDRILIKTLSSTSGYVTIKTHDGTKDSILNINDSINLKKYINPKSASDGLKLKVFAADLLQTREYSLSIRKHKHDPDSLRWQYVGKVSSDLSVEHKSVIFKKQILTYYTVGNELRVSSISTEDPTVQESKSTTGGLSNKLPSSILSYKDKVYATSETPDGKVYESADGITWIESNLFNGDYVHMLLAPLSNKISYIKETGTGVDKKHYFNSTGEISTARAEIILQEVPKNFPTSNINYTTYSTSTKQSAVMLVGEYQDGQQPTVGAGDKETKTVVPWAYMGNIWVELPPNNIDTNCPALKKPAIISYNNQYQVFGSGFDSFYTSLAGIAWKKATKKFSFPYYTDWANNPTYAPETHPEFRGRTNYSYVLDPSTAYIWIIFSNESATFKDKGDKEYTYHPGGAEIWRGRLNQLWFDVANNKYTY